MKRIIAYISLVFSIMLILNNCVQKNDFPGLKGPYLGRESPGMTPELLAPGIISTEKNAEYGGHFSPDMKAFYFSRVSPDNQGKIWMTEYVNKKWTPPQIVPFMKDFPGVESCISPDGNRFYFVWYDSESEHDVHDFYVSERSETKWGIPHQLTKTELGKRRISPSIASSGNLYFSGDHDTPGQKDIYFSRFMDGEYATPKNLGSAVNSEYHEEHVFVAPDESYILFDSYRSSEYGKSDIYISFKKEDDAWSDAKNLGPEINSEHYDWYPNVTPDGKFIIFTRTLPGGKLDLYWVDAKILKELKARDIK